MRAGKQAIVYVESDPGLVELVSLVLGRKEFSLVGAATAREGLDVVRRTKPDLVLLELSLPDMDGWEAYRHLRADPETAPIPVIVVTSRAQSVDQVLGVHLADVDDYVTKPFGPETLLNTVRAVMGRQS